jgi:hypothetical protein
MKLFNREVPDLSKYTDGVEEDIIRLPISTICKNDKDVIVLLKGLFGSKSKEAYHKLLLIGELRVDVMGHNCYLIKG